MFTGWWLNPNFDESGKTMYLTAVIWYHSKKKSLFIHGFSVSTRIVDIR